jgi:hypothetical protein
LKNYPVHNHPAIEYSPITRLPGPIVRTEDGFFSRALAGNLLPLCGNCDGHRSLRELRWPFLPLAGTAIGMTFFAEAAMGSYRPA